MNTLKNNNHIEVRMQVRLAALQARNTTDKRRCKRAKRIFMSLIGE